MATTRFLITVKNERRKVIAGPLPLESDSEQSAIDEFTARTKGAHLAHGHIVEVEQASKPKASFLYFRNRNDQWAPTL